MACHSKIIAGGDINNCNGVRFFIKLSSPDTDTEILFQTREHDTPPLLMTAIGWCHIQRLKSQLWDRF
jgi:hypothetical protein